MSKPKSRRADEISQQTEETGDELQGDAEKRWLEETDPEYAESEAQSIRSRTSRRPKRPDADVPTVYDPDEMPANKAVRSRNPEGYEESVGGLRRKHDDDDNDDEDEDRDETAEERAKTRQKVIDFATSIDQMLQATRPMLKPAAPQPAAAAASSSPSPAPQPSQQPVINIIMQQQPDARYTVKPGTMNNPMPMSGRFPVRDLPYDLPKHPGIQRPLPVREIPQRDIDYRLPVYPALQDPLQELEEPPPPPPPRAPSANLLLPSNKTYYDHRTDVLLDPNKYYVPNNAAARALRFSRPPGVGSIPMSAPPNSLPFIPYVITNQQAFGPTSEKTIRRWNPASLALLSPAEREEVRAAHRQEILRNDSAPAIYAALTPDEARETERARLRYQRYRQVQQEAERTRASVRAGTALPFRDPVRVRGLQAVTQAAKTDLDKMIQQDINLTAWRTGELAPFPQSSNQQQQ